MEIKTNNKTLLLKIVGTLAQSSCSVENFKKERKLNI